MAILVFVESAEGKIKKTSIEAVAYALMPWVVRLQPSHWVQLIKVN